VLRNIFASKRVELTGDERKLHKKELRDLHFCISALLHFSTSALLTRYYLGDKIKNNVMGRALGTRGRVEMHT
jgi:hypothetical protein